jgi:putative transposase
MPRVARIIAAQYPHHVTQRGNNRATVFFDDEDRDFYLETLGNYCRKWHVKVWAYCLMTNHVHILAVPEGQESLACCMGRTNLVYTQYVNRKYSRSGRLWQNRFYSTIVETEPYLWMVVRYIEQNPVKSKLVNNPEDYKWSSCLFNTSGKGNDLVNDHEWLDKKDRESYRTFLMQQDTEKDQRIRRATSTGRPLGSNDFIAKLEIKLARKLFPGKAGRPKKLNSN